MNDRYRNHLSRKMITAIKILMPAFFVASTLMSFIAARTLFQTDHYVNAITEIQSATTVVSREALTILISRFTPMDEKEFSTAIDAYNRAIADSREILADYPELDSLVRLDNYISPILNKLVSSLDLYGDSLSSFGSLPLLERRNVARQYGIEEAESMENFLRLEDIISELTFYLDESSRLHAETLTAVADRIADVRERAFRIVFSAISLFLLGVAGLMTGAALERTYKARIAESAALDRSEALEDLVSARTEDLEIQNRQLREAGEMLAEREKIISLGQVVSGVAHEVNTPLGICVTATTYLSDLANDEERELDRKEASDVLKLILENISRASNLVKGFKNVAIDEMDDDCRSFDLASYLREDLLPGLGSTLTRNRHRIELSGPETCPVYSYPGSIAQVVINLVKNASIHGYGKTENVVIEVKLEEKTNKVVLSVTDSGMGMTEDTRTKIFEPFYTTNRENGGSGLGMMVVHNITVVKLNGSIECISAPGQGTTVRITIPKDSRVREINPPDQSG